MYQNIYELHSPIVINIFTNIQKDSKNEKVAITFLLTWDLD